MDERRMYRVERGTSANQRACLALAAPSDDWSTSSEPELRLDVERIARTYGAILYRRALRFTSDAGDAWDLLQNTYEKALSAAPLGLSDVQALAWLKVVMRNHYLDQFRARNRHPQLALEVDLVPSPDEEEAPGARPWSDLTLDEIRACVGYLTEPLRRVYEMHALEGLSYAEISVRLQVSAVTVGTRLVRARQKLRDVILCGAAGGVSGDRRS
jgi:RNA polymerase sigma-70 factor, ECF subfamily